MTKRKNIPTIEELEKRIERIEYRNSKVTEDKAWEISLFRRLAIMATTYLVIGYYMSEIGAYEPWKNAVIPVIGFLLSTMTINALRKAWVKKFYKK